MSGFSRTSILLARRPGKEDIDSGVYQIDIAPVSASLKESWRRLAWSRVSATVWYLGATSLLTDVSSEMITSILPVYLVLNLQMTPLAFGTIDGAYNASAAVVRTASGFMADRWRRYKQVAAVGYGLSAVSKLGFLTVGPAFSPLVAIIVGDRLGKGIRTAPRDALISLSAAPGELGTSFGVHRTLDAAGATIGPVVAFALLLLVPGRFDLVFFTSFWVAIVGLAVLLLFVRGGRATTGGDPVSDVSVRMAIDLLRAARFRAVLITACILALATVSDAFVYLTLQQTVGFDGARLPLLYVGTPLCYFALAGPMGLLADRIGPRITFVAGHVVLLLLYGLLLGVRPGVVGPIASVVLLGGYYAATDGVLAALASGTLPISLRGTGLALLATGSNLARAAASLAFGVTWTWWGRETTLTLFAVALCAAMVVAFFQLGFGRTVEL